MPDTGDTFTYSGDTGLAAAARAADPGVDDHLAAEHAALDMPPGTVVTVSGHDTERDLVLVDWIDAQGNPRTTSIDPEVFADQFDPEG